MTNFEKWKDELKIMVAESKQIAIVNGKPVCCDDVIGCSGCYISSCDSTVQKEILRYTEWLLDEYKEKPKLTKRQRGFLEALQTGWGARDEDGSLYFYEGKPERSIGSRGSWSFSGKCVPASYSMIPDFPFIMWEDEPYSIEEMLTWEVEEEEE